MPRQITSRLLVMLLLAFGLAWARVGQALTITPIPPTATQVSPTQETIGWQTDLATTSDQVRYGLSYTNQWAQQQI
ncbi:MAG: hypothetical protein HY421_01200, partial [Candidatus Kerfeldbacteria bacterium]|nr:hypothetical protein [Candidatus Kerfeldbacteria bacterium]